MARLRPDSGRAVSALLGDGNVLPQTVWSHEMFSDLHGKTHSGDGQLLTGRRQWRFHPGL